MAGESLELEKCFADCADWFMLTTIFLIWLQWPALKSMPGSVYVYIA
jgi:hypothetical protein